MAYTQDTTDSPFTRFRPQVQPYGVVAGGSTTPPTSSTPSSPTDPYAQYSSYDPNLVNIYRNAGYMPGGAGSGFADIAYWSDKPSQWNRLAADIAGTGSDQPTGTPWATGPWQKSGAGAPAGGGGGGGFGGSLSPFVAQAFQAPAYQPSAALKDPRAGQLYDTLMKRAQMGENVTAQDPIIRAQVEPFRAEATRGAKSALSAMAEKGSPNANMDAATRSQYEKAGQATGAFQAQAMTNELAARRAEINQALSGASGLLTSEQQMGLQDELAKLDAALSAWGTTQGLGAQESEFARNLAQRAYEFDTGQYNTLYGG